MKTKICRYNKFGYCKYADKCNFKHNDVICVNKNCNVFECEMRHPVMCRHFTNFRKCKFTNCAYKHSCVFDNDEITAKIETVENKLTEVIKDSNVKEIEKKLAVFEKKYEGQTKALEEQYVSQLKELEKNYVTKIDILDKKYIGRIEDLEDKLAKKMDAFEKLLEKQNKLISMIESNVKEVKETAKETTAENQVVKATAQKTKEKFKCNVCDFEANTKQGLGVHIKRKHTSYTEESLPNKCEICDHEFINFENKPWSKQEIENHIMSHSYQSSDYLNYKCSECEFWGPNSLTMELHIKKFHSENITCGLCGYEAKSIEDLETHSATCETYGCSECEDIFKNLCEIKEHTDKAHQGKELWIKHSKSERKYPEFCNSTPT